MINTPDDPKRVAGPGELPSDHPRVLAEPYQCEDCDALAVEIVTEYDVEDRWCRDCYDRHCEMAWERSQEGECFRGGESAAYEAEQQETARRLK